MSGPIPAPEPGRLQPHPIARTYQTITTARHRVDEPIATYRDRASADRTTTALLGCRDAPDAGGGVPPVG